MYIYAEKITPRLEYIVHTLFRGMRVAFTSSREDFFHYDGVKINYSPKRFTDTGILVQPHGLLSETGIKKQEISCTEWQGLKIFFQGAGDIPFDIFSAAFYLISRYEEYLPHEKDSYGRFAHEASLAYKAQFLNIPLVDYWRNKLMDVLVEKNPAFVLPTPSFSFVPTYDIDIAYAQRGRGFITTMLRRLKGRKTIVNGRDAFDVYEWLDALHATHRLSPVYFFLLARHRSRYDKNIPRRSAALKKLARKTADRYQAGIHPSWQSYHDGEALSDEIRYLQRVTGKKVASSRLHYIRFTLPNTFRQLMDKGITDDYSMGYGSINGFRASFASPFYWYDILKEETTSLLLHPFCYMDANSFFEQKFTAEQAAEELLHYYNAVKRSGGELVTISHNHFLTEEPEWQPWREMYSAFLENVSKGI